VQSHTSHSLADDALTTREREVLSLIAMGLTNRQIGDELFVGVETVRTHVRQVFRKLGVTNRTQAAMRFGQPSVD